MFSGVHFRLAALILCAALAQSGSARDTATPPVSNGMLTAPIPKAAPVIPLPDVKGPRDRRRPLIVIDPGHGGHDPGAVNPVHGWREKDVTLAIARAIRDELLKTGRYRVALTRDGDAFLALQERYGIAQRLKASLMISVHADAAEDDAARGASVYTLSETASDREAARLAARENRADILNGIDLSGQTSTISSILIDLARRDTMAASARFAEILAREGPPDIPFQRRAHHFAALVVLKSADTPSVLLEAGYISNAADGAALGSREGQRRIARGVRRAVAVFFARR